MNRCDVCEHNDSCVCIPYGCENFELNLEKHDARIRADVINEALTLCTYSRQLNDEEYDKGFEDGVALVRRRLRQMRVTLVQKRLKQMQKGAEE